MSIKLAEEDHGLTLDVLETYWGTWTDTMKRKLQQLAIKSEQDDHEKMSELYNYLDGYIEAVGDMKGPWDSMFVRYLMDAIYDWTSIGAELAAWIRKQHV